jgi:hypothetical protein
MHQNHLWRVIVSLQKEDQQVGVELVGVMVQGLGGYFGWGWIVRTEETRKQQKLEMHQWVMLEKMVWSTRTAGDRQEGWREQMGLSDGAAVVAMKVWNEGVWTLGWLGLAAPV